MLSYTSFLVITLFSINFVQGSSPSLKRKELASSPSPNNKAKYTRFETSSIFRDTSKEHLDMRATVRKTTPLNNTPSSTSTTESHSTGATTSQDGSVSPPSSIQLPVPQPDNHVPMTSTSSTSNPDLLQDKSKDLEDLESEIDQSIAQLSLQHHDLGVQIPTSKPPRTSGPIVLRDMTNNVEVVNLIIVPNMVQPPPRQVLQGMHLDAIRTNVPNDDGVYSYHYPLQRICLSVMDNLSNWNFDSHFGNYVIGFCFFSMGDRLVVRLVVSDRVPGQMSLQFLGLKQPYQGKGEIYDTLELTSVSSIVDTIVPLNRLQDVHNLMNANAYLYFKVHLQIEPGHYDIFIQNPSPAQVLHWEIERHTNYFKELMSKRNYAEVERTSNTIVNKVNVLKCYCLSVKTKEDFIGLMRYMRYRQIFEDFLVYGGLSPIRSGIFAFSYSSTEGFLESTQLLRAIKLSFAKNRYARAVDLLEIAYSAKWQRVKNYKFEKFVEIFFDSCADRLVLFKSFISTYGERFKRNMPGLFNALCQGIVGYARRKNQHAAGNTLLYQLVGQPSLLTTTTFVDGFFRSGASSNKQRSNFVTCAWSESIQEGLKTNYKRGGVRLWAALKEAHPYDFAGDYINTDDWRMAIGSTFSTKKELEEIWNDQNAPIFHAKLANIVVGSLDFIPRNIWRIIAEYAVTWVVA